MSRPILALLLTTARWLSRRLHDAKTSINCGIAGSRDRVADADEGQDQGIKGRSALFAGAEPFLTDGRTEEQLAARRRADTQTRRQNEGVVMVKMVLMMARHSFFNQPQHTAISSPIPPALFALLCSTSPSAPIVTRTTIQSHRNLPTPLPRMMLMIM